MIDQEKLVRAITILVQDTQMGNLKWQLCADNNIDIATVIRNCYKARFSPEVYLLVYQKSTYKEIKWPFNDPLQPVAVENILAFTDNTERIIQEISGRDIVVVNELARAVQRQAGFVSDQTLYQNSVNSILSKGKDKREKDEKIHH